MCTPASHISFIWRTLRIATPKLSVQSCLCVATLVYMSQRISALTLQVRYEFNNIIKSQSSYRMWSKSVMYLQTSTSNPIPGQENTFPGIVAGPASSLQANTYHPGAKPQWKWKTKLRNVAPNRADRLAGVRRGRKKKEKEKTIDTVDKIGSLTKH